jgi:hypothetical protein
MRKKTREQRPRRKYVKARTIPVYVVMRRRGNACLTVAGLLTVFWTAVMLGSAGGWSVLHTWVTLAVAAAAFAAVACYVAAAIRTQKQSVLARPVPAPRAGGDSPVTHPGVSHLHPVPVLTAPEEAK